MAAGPLLVHTTAMWAHTCGAALGGVSAVLLLDILRGKADLKRVVGLAAALAALCLVRDEGLLLAASTLLVLGFSGLRRAGSPVAKVLTAARWSVFPAVVVAATYVASHAWSAHVAPGPYLVQTVDQWYHVSWLDGRWLGLVHTLFSGGGSMPLATRWAAVLGASLFLVGGVVLARAGHGTRAVAAGFGCVIGGLVLVVLRSVWLIPIDLGGLLVAAPLLSLAVGSFQWRRLGSAARAMVVWCRLYGLAVLAHRQYPGGRQPATGVEATCSRRAGPARWSCAVAWSPAWSMLPPPAPIDGPSPTCWWRPSACPTMAGLHRHPRRPQRRRGAHRSRAGPAIRRS